MECMGKTLIGEDIGYWSMGKIRVRYWKGKILVYIYDIGMICGMGHRGYKSPYDMYMIFCKCSQVQFHLKKLYIFLFLPVFSH